MSQPVQDTGKLQEALELLNAAARDKGDELKLLMTDKYDDVKHMMGGVVEKSAAWMKKTGKAGAATAVRLETGAVKGVKRAAISVDRSAHGYPWIWIGGATLVGSLVGIIVSHPRRNGAHKAAAHTNGKSASAAK